MFRLDAYCNDGKHGQYWENGINAFEIYDRAYIYALESALVEAHGLMEDCGEEGYWFEVETFFEVTDSYVADTVELGTIFDVAVVRYDHAPWARDNDCEITVVTGYLIGEVK